MAGKVENHNQSDCRTVQPVEVQVSCQVPILQSHDCSGPGTAGLQGLVVTSVVAGQVVIN